jgi:hypothetical protein
MILSPLAAMLTARGRFEHGFVIVPQVLVSILVRSDFETQKSESKMGSKPHHPKDLLPAKDWIEFLE